MKIWFKGNYDFSTESYFTTSLKESTFLFSVDNQKISISIDYVNKKIKLNCQYDISNELYAWIIKTPSENNRIDNIHPELQKIISNFDICARQMISLIKYALNHFEINDNLLRDPIEWSDNDSDYKCIDRTERYIEWYRYDIDIDTSENSIQEYLDTGFLPFISLKFLHRAVREDNPTFKIIDATIAAEIAIKEFLIEKNKEKLDLGVLLLELPSPPLLKLYGRILQFYGGENKQFAQKNIIDKGSQLRNILIHSPNELDISYELADFYCLTIQYTIFYLLSLLYTDDKLIKQIFDSYAQSINEYNQTKLEKDLNRILKNYRSSRIPDKN